MFKLVGTDGNRVFSFPLSDGSYTIGREETADFVIPDRTVSRAHARLEVQDGGKKFSLRDLGSRNGTVIDGRRISDAVPVAPGNKILFGQVQFRISLSESDALGAPTSSTRRLAEREPEKSVFLSINEALKPLPSKVTDLPNVLPTLFEMAKILVLPEPKEVMLGQALRLVAKAIPADRLAVLHTSKSEEDVVAIACILPSGRDPGDFTLSKTIVDEILTKQTSILINPHEDPKFAGQESIILLEIHSAMAVPLFDSGKVLGILYIDSKNPLHRYNDDYLRLLATFGNLIASRLVNYELMREREQKQVFEAELKRASSIQNNLLTKHVPELDGYSLHAYQEQCRMVGGDLYDIAALADGRVLMAVADVSGKGMGGALLMSNILASFRSLYNDSEFNLRTVVKQVSLQLFRYSAPEDFATLFICALNRDTHELEYVNAGHNPPLLLRGDGRHEYLEPGGIMIGAFDFADWESSRITLHPRDRLVVFTDGVVEADNRGSHYGDERLLKIVRENSRSNPRDLCEVIIRDVLAFVDDQPRSDDITLLVLERK